jgi:predicted kinase
MKAIITVGISASGKSVFATKWVNESPTNRAEINRDNIRRSLVEADGNEWSWNSWSWKREKEVTEIANKQIKIFADSGFDLIVSDTNLNTDRLKQLEQSLKAFGYDVEIKEFPITIEEAWKRDAARKDGVGHSVIAKQYEAWLKYLSDKPHETNTDNPIDFPKKKYLNGDITKPTCILVDIDGTLAHANNKRGMFEWDKVGYDDIDSAVKSIVNAYYNDATSVKEKHVIILSGRDGVCEDSTRDWLHRHNVSFDALIMRKAGDMRKDTIIKEEIFWRDIADNYAVELVIDDRPSVCRMWRNLGLKVLQVGNPYIEF